MLHIQGKNQFITEVVQFQGVVIVDFYADWCGPCRMLGPIMEQLANENVGRAVKVVKVNVDDNPDLAAEFGIMGVPTVFIYHNGQIVENFVGVQPKMVYQEKIDTLLGMNKSKILME